MKQYNLGFYSDMHTEHITYGKSKMDLFYNTFIFFMDLLYFGYLDVPWRDRNLSSFFKNNFIYVLKMNKSHMGLVRKEPLEKLTLKNYNNTSRFK